VPEAQFRFEPGEQRQLAASLFNHVWSLLAKPDRSASDDDEMIHAAHASRHHWGAAGEPVHWARGEWQCSRVYAVLGRSEPALHHAERCLALSTAHGLGPFDTGAAHEAIARAYRAAGDTAKAAEHVAAGWAEYARITDPEDREILAGDLAGLGGDGGP
jgi:hypothetical protein